MTQPMVNTNPRTGVAYGLIAANALDGEIVERLMFGGQARDLLFEKFCEELRDEIRIAAAENGFVEGSADSDAWQDDEFERRVARERHDPDEPEIEGRYEGVSYRTTWIGGALHFWIFESPHTTDKARRASPCAPGAAILDTLDGSESGYDVPADWRVDYARVEVAPDGMLTYYYGDESIDMQFHNYAECGAPWQMRLLEACNAHIKDHGGRIAYGVELDAAPWVADFWRAEE